MLQSINRIVFGLAFVSIFSAIATSGELVFTPLRGSCFEPILLQLGWPNVIVFDLSIGYLTTLFFWWLVVYLPEKQRRAVIRNNLAYNYQIFKEDIVSILLSTSNNGSDYPEATKLASDHEAFKKYFRENKEQRWYAALNGLNKEDERTIDFALIKLNTELSYTLSSLPIQDEKVHDTLKNLQNSIHQLEWFKRPEYNGNKYLANFIWSILTCFCNKRGYLEEDEILSAINRI